jgi:hypothetical protein
VDCMEAGKNIEVLMKLNVFGLMILHAFSLHPSLHYKIYKYMPSRSSTTYLGVSCTLPKLFPRPPTQNYTLIGYFSRIVFPYLNSSAGTGMKAIARKPSMLLPQPSPRLWYILGPANGRRAPKRQRSAVIPAMADAANCGKQSIM